LPVKLNRDELILKAKELSALYVKIQEAEEAKKSAASAHADEIKKMNSELNQLVRIVNTGNEYRQVECSERKNFSIAIIETYRDDLGTMVETRPMTESERQAELFPGPKQVEGEQTA
jgi:hypothetical protein